MTQIIKIAKWEYLNRVKTKLFIITTLLLPVLFALISILPTWLATLDPEKTSKIGLIYGSKQTALINDFKIMVQNQYKTKNGIPEFSFVNIDNDQNALSKILDKTIQGYLSVSPNILDSDGLVPIAYSLANEDQKMFDLLIEAGAKINKTILDESSLLIFYINNKRFTMIEKLIENGADIHKQDSNGMTAMMHAIEKMNLNAVRILSTKKLDLSLTDFSGKTIVDYANRSRNLPIKRIIENLQSLSD